MARSAEPCELNSSIVVDKPIQHCWDLYTDNTALADWAPTITNVESTETVVAINSTRKTHVLVDGKQGHTVEHCTHLSPLKRIEMTISEESFGFSHMLTDYGITTTFDVEENQTLMMLQTRYVPKKIFASLMSAKTTQQPILVLMNQTLASFKQYAELA